MSLEALRRRLIAVRDRTAAGAGDVVPGCFIGDEAAERILRANAWAGRIEWRAAHNHAVFGLEKLEAVERALAALLAADDAGDVEAMERAGDEIEAGMEIALAAVEEAEALQGAGAVASLTPKGRAKLGTSAKLPGRPSENAERNRRLAETVERCMDRGRPRGWLNAAIAAALAADPALAEAFAGETHQYLVDAYRAGRKV